MNAWTWLPEHMNRPLPINWAIRLKNFSILLILLAAFSVMYSGLSAPRASYHENPLRTDILVVAGITLLHLGYLWIVFDMAVMASPVENVMLGKAIPPVLLSIVYMLYGVQSLLVNMAYLSLASSIKLAAYLAFILIYLVWAVNDFAKLNKKWIPDWRLALWLVADFVSVFILLTYPLGWFDGFHLLGYSVSAKDGAVFLCITVWLIFRVVMHFAKRNSYQAEYTKYLAQMRHVRLVGNVPQLNLKSNTELTVVDVGCGDGTRLVQLIDWLKQSGQLASDVNISATGFDRDDTWKDAFESTCRGRGIQLKFVEDDVHRLIDNIKSANIVLLSHVIYDPAFWPTVAGWLKHCNKNAVVVVRGTSARSFFTVINLAHSRRLTRPTVSHLWYRGVEYLIRHAGLERMESCCRVKQPYALTDNGDETATHVLNNLYGEGPAQLAKEYFSELKKEKVQKIPNDDLIIFLKAKWSTT